MSEYEAIFEQYLRFGWSIKMDVYRTSEHPEINKAVEVVWASLPEGNRQAKTEQKMLECLKMLLCNLLVAYKSDKCLAIPRKAEAFSEPNRFGKLFIPRTAFLAVVDGMLANNWIGMASGYQPIGKEGRLTRIWAKSGLHAFFDEVSEHDISTQVGDVVILNNEDEKEIPYDDTPSIVKLRDNLGGINSFYDQNYFAYSRVAEKRYFNQFWFLSRDSNLDTILTNLNIPYTSNQFVNILHQYIIHPDNPQHLYIPYHYGNRMQFEQVSDKSIRLFPRVAAIYCRGSFRMGGRLYGKPSRGESWQSLSQATRRTVTINQEPTVELDYSGLHVAMLYARKGIQMTEKPYKIDENDEMKPIYKKLLLTVINAEDENKAINSMKQEVWELQQSPILKERDLKFLTAVTSSNPDWKSLIGKVKKAHAPIRDYFCSDEGVNLQRIDSKIMLDVVGHFTQEGIPCLPVHDSVIISKWHEEELWQKMDEAYRANMNGFYCVIEKK